MWLKLWSYKILRTNQPCIWEPIGVYYTEAYGQLKNLSKITNKDKIGTVDFRFEFNRQKFKVSLKEFCSKGKNLEKPLKLKDTETDKNIEHFFLKETLKQLYFYDT